MIQAGERRAKGGVLAIGLDAYWGQFAGLKERLEGYQQSVEQRIGPWATVVSPGLVDTAPKVHAAGRRFAEERVDLIFCPRGHATQGRAPVGSGVRRRVKDC